MLDMHNVILLQQNEEDNVPCVKMWATHTHKQYAGDHYNQDAIHHIDEVNVDRSKVRAINVWCLGCQSRRHHN